MPLLAEAQIRTGAQYPYAPHTEPYNARRRYEPRFVPKKPSTMPLPRGLVRTPLKPKTRAMEPRTDRTDRTAYPQSREPNPGHIRERWLKSRSEAVRSGVGRFLGLDAPLPRPSPAAHCRDPPQLPGVWGELNPTQRRYRQAYPLEALAGLPQVPCHLGR